MGRTHQVPFLQVINFLQMPHSAKAGLMAYLKKLLAFGQEARTKDSMNVMYAFLQVRCMQGLV
jgi:hypothetical protein